MSKNTAHVSFYVNGFNYKMDADEFRDMIAVNGALPKSDFGIFYVIGTGNSDAVVNIGRKDKITGTGQDYNSVAFIENSRATIMEEFKNAEAAFKAAHGWCIAD